MGYRTRTRSLTSSDAKRISKKPKLETLDEAKLLMMTQLKDQVKQKTKSRSDGELFNGIQENQEKQESEVQVQMTLKEDELLSKIKDEIQAWVIPEVIIKVM